LKSPALRKNKMQKLFSPREKIILFATIYIAVFGILFKFLFVPVLNRNEYLNKEINAVSTKLKKYKQLLKNKQDILERYKKFSADFKFQEDTQEEPLASGLSELQKLAGSANIRIIDMRPQSAARKNPAQKEFSVDLRTEGLIEGYLKFIYNIETSVSLLNIERLQLTVQPNTQNLEGNFSISKNAE